VQFLADQVGAVFDPLFAPCDINENLLHCHGGSLEEMPAIGELLITLAGDLQPRLMHERRGLKCLAAPLASHLMRGKPAKLLVNQRQQLFGGTTISPVEGLQRLGDVAH
jgi:hypothetical protein